MYMTETMKQIWQKNAQNMAIQGQPLRGVDLSEHNGEIPIETLLANELEFVIIRAGYGNGHVDKQFYANYKAILASPLQLGVYYYSYALTPQDAYREGEFLGQLLKSAGLTPAHLPLKIWLDMEDDGFKSERITLDAPLIMGISQSFMDALYHEGYADVGIYANLWWLQTYFEPSWLARYPVWAAQYSAHCDYENAYMWQYTDSLNMEGCYYDAEYLLRP